MTTSRLRHNAAAFAFLPLVALFFVLSEPIIGAAQGTGSQTLQSGSLFVAGSKTVAGVFEVTPRGNRQFHGIVTITSANERFSGTVGDFVVLPDGHISLGRGGLLTIHVYKHQHGYIISKIQVLDNTSFKASL